jgi:4-amino-4-deoxy-L-arabinose transferase-like glycosyltransferase
MLVTRYSTLVARRSQLSRQDAGTPERLSLVGCRLPLLRLVLLLIVVWGLLTIRLGAAWFGYHDWNGVHVGSAVRNLRLYGAWNLRLMQDYSPGPATPETHHIYNHRPPMIVWVTALAAVPLGFNEASLRFVPASATLISVAALYTLSRRLHGPTRAWWSAALYALTPMVAYFGRMPDHEAPSLAVSMVYAAVLVNWLRCPTRRRWLALAGLAWIGVWTDWTALLYVGTLGAMTLWLGRPPQRRAMLALGGVTLAALVALGAYLLQGPGALDSLTGAFLTRTSPKTLGLGPAGTFTWGEFLGRELRRLLMLATPGVAIMSLAGVVPALRRDSRLGSGILLAFFVVGIGYPLAFRNAAYIHDYLLIFMLPPMAMAASAALEYGWAGVGVRRWARPALSALLLVSLGVGAANLVLLHKSGEQPHHMAVAQAIARHTAPQDLIASNLPYISPAVEFYAFRNVEWDTSPEAALARAETVTGGVVYAHCAGVKIRTLSNNLYIISQKTILPDPPDAPPAELAGLPYEVDGGCLFFRLR